MGGYCSHPFKKGDMMITNCEGCKYIKSMQKYPELSYCSLGYCGKFEYNEGCKKKKVI